MLADGNARYTQKSDSCFQKIMELDYEFNEIVYYYLRAANEELNTLFDERFGSYWCMVNNLSQYLIPLSPPVYE